MNIFIIHGACGHPQENWFPHLKSELEKLGHSVIVPAFPTPKRHSLVSWMEVMRPYLGEIDSDTVFVAHSMGPAFVLSLIERLEVRVKACVFVAGFIGKLGIPEFDSINASFMEKGFNWEKIRENCGAFYMYASENDPYVPLELEKELARRLGAELILVKDAGHFNEKAGYTSFPELLELVAGL